MLCASIDEFRAALPERRRLIGLDVGEKTVGIAMSDAGAMIATPMETIVRAKFSKDAETLKRIAQQHGIGGIIVGYPINMNGSEGPRCQSIRQFCKNLMPHLALPMMLWDERMSTLAVERTMLEADLSRGRRAELVDKMAAAYILQGFLDRFAHHNKEAGSA